MADAAFDKLVAAETKQEHETRKRASANSTMWMKGQLGINQDGVRFEINKVTAKRVQIRKLLPYRNGKPVPMMAQLLADFDSVEGKGQHTATKIDDDFLWGSKTGYIQRCTGQELKPWPKMNRGKKRRLTLT